MRSCLYREETKQNKMSGFCYLSTEVWSFWEIWEILICRTWWRLATRLIISLHLSSKITKGIHLLCKSVHAGLLVLAYILAILSLYQHSPWLKDPKGYCSSSWLTLCFFLFLLYSVWGFFSGFNLLNSNYPKPVIFKIFFFFFKLENVASLASPVL